MKRTRVRWSPTGEWAVYDHHGNLCEWQVGGGSAKVSRVYDDDGSIVSQSIGVFFIVTGEMSVRPEYQGPLQRLDDGALPLLGRERTSRGGRGWPDRLQELLDEADPCNVVGARIVLPGDV